METAVVAPRASGRFHVEPAVTAAVVGWLLAFGGAVLWRLLVDGPGIEVTDWRVLGCVGINLVTLVLLWSERRRVLAHPPREPGAEEASWTAAAADLAMRRRLQDPRSLALVALFVVLVPWTLWLWFRFAWMIVALFGCFNLLLVADSVAEKRAEDEGSIDMIAGAQVPRGWWVLGALAVGLPLVWLPVVLMTSAAGATALRLLAIPILNGLAWWSAGAGWQRRWRVDRRLGGIPVDWHWRQRFHLLRSFPIAALALAYLLANPYSAPEIEKLIGSGSSGDLLWMLWWPVILGLLGIGVFVHTGRVRPPALGAGAGSESRSR